MINYACFVFSLTFTTVTFHNVYGLPQFNQNAFSNFLNSTSIVGSFGHASSVASADGPGSTVGISGVVTGDSSTSIGTQNRPDSGPTSSISSVTNCSDFSTSNANGSTSADALSTGGCLSDVDDTGNHQISPKVEIGMETLVTGPGNQTNSTSLSDGLNLTVQQAQVAQLSTQNYNEGQAEASQIISGQQASTQFSGIMAAAIPHGDTSFDAGTSQTAMTHSSGNTMIESVFEPYGTALV